MSAKLTLSVGILTQRPEAIALAAQLAKGVAATFSASSGKDIRLHVVDRGLMHPSASGALHSDTLHQALERMTGFQQGQQQVSEIGLLIADSFAPARGFFGLMFDDAFVPGGSNPWALTPREGCAVFLDAIENARQPKDLMAEAIFTAVHELGHVFNLQHGSPPSFMTRSAVTGPVALDNAGFSPYEQRLLACCSRSRHIWPGGSRFGDLGDLAASSTNPDPSNRPPIRLKVESSHHRFWQFEPVELDVSISTDSTRGIKVPDAVDAGHREFELWIEEPGGERRKLRSPRHYCAPRGVLTVRAGQDFRRDISLFGEAGGYTFRQAGIHRVWAEFEFAASRRVRSNLLELEVLANDPSSETWQHAHQLFPHRNAGQLMYYRRLDAQRRRQLARLQQFCELHRRHPTTAMVHYAMGRALADAVLRSRTRPAAALVRQARSHLRSAARRAGLGEHRQAWAETMLTALEAN